MKLSTAFFRVARGRLAGFLIIAALAFLVNIPVLFHKDTVFFRLNTDYDSVLSTYEFLVRYIRDTGTIPTSNPYLMTGIPVVADPNSFVLNPLGIVPEVLFGTERGLCLMIFLAFVLSGWGMYVLLEEFKVSWSLRIWGSLLYVFSGNLVAYVASGHTPELLSYPAVPLFFAVMLKPALTVRRIILAALILTYVFFSGYNYLLWLFAIVYLVIRMYFVLVQKHSALKELSSAAVLMILFLAFSGIKLVPFILTVSPILVRYFPINPLVGSVHFFLYPLGFLMPLELNFYDRPFFKRLFGYYYNWHEYYAFLSPFPFVFLLRIKKIFKLHQVQVLFFVIIISAAYIALKFPYSPFFWLYRFSSFARNFRIPSRIYEPTTAAVIALCVLAARSWFVESSHRQRTIGRVLCILALVVTGIASFITLTNAFEPRREREESIVRELRQSDQSTFYVAVLGCCMQQYLVRERIPVINAYFAWRPKDSPDFVNSRGDDYNFDRFYDVRPRYILAAPRFDLHQYGYIPFIANETIRVWKTGNENIFPNL